MPTPKGRVASVWLDKFSYLFVSGLLEVNRRGEMVHIDRLDVLLITT